MNRSFIHEDLQSGRWIPPWLRHQNLARYRWAAQFVFGKDVVEVGCGSGHGAHMLAEAGATCVRGFDVEADAIKQARSTYAAPNLRFEVASGDSLPAPNATCDVCVSLETIEHIADTSSYLREVSRILRDDGIFLCSTPNRNVTNPGKSIDQRPFNRHHVREYAPSEFKSVLSEQFSHVELFGQRCFGRFYVSLIGKVGHCSPWFGYRLHQARKLLLLPFEKYERHVPRTVHERDHPEVLVAIARK